MNEVCYLNVRVVPSSKKFDIEIIDYDKREVKVYVKEPPVKNKANKELLKNLRNIFRCNIEIIRGTKSFKKTIKVELPCDKVMRLLGSKGMNHDH